MTKCHLQKRMSVHAMVKEISFFKELIIFIFQKKIYKVTLFYKYMYFQSALYFYKFINLT